MNYECHITIPIDYAGPAFDDACKVAGWSTSRIMGDPVLAPDKPFAYANRHARVLTHLRHDMTTFADVLRGMGIPVLREKIEIIIYDTKTGEGL